MRIASLSSVELAESGQPRAFLRVGGRSVLEWQIGLARRLGCKRILCLCNPEQPEILRLQKDVEAQGAEFHAVRSPAQVAALVRDEDCLVAMADGLLVDLPLAESILVSDQGLKPAVYTFPADDPAAAAHASVFERLDPERLWAGLLVADGRIARELEHWPVDSNVPSLLTRIALQTRCKTIAAPADALQDGRWLLVDEPEIAAKHESKLVRQMAPPNQWQAPGLSIANLVARAVAGRGSGIGPRLILVAGLTMLLVAIALAYVGLPTFGVFVAALALIAAETGFATRRIETAMRMDDKSSRKFDYRYMIVDLLVVLTLVFAVRAEGLVATSLPLFAWGLARIAAVRSGQWLAPFWNDRTVHLAALAVCAVYGVLEEALAAFGLLALVQTIARVDVWQIYPVPTGPGTRRK